MSCLYMINMGIDIVLQLLGIVDIFELLPFTHILMAVNVFYVFYALNYEVKQADNEIAKQLRIPLGIVMLFASSELILYYVNRFRETSVFLSLGTIIYIAMLMWIQVVQYYRVKMKELQLDYFEKLATTDILTGALNRNAYESHLKELNTPQESDISLGVIMFDVNNMKFINDRFGHEKGDEAIRLCFKCICDAFGSDGSCFRIGGDEFVYISYQPEKLQQEILIFEQLISAQSQLIEFPFSVAYGYALYDPNCDKTFSDTIRRSDRFMYLNKKQQKTSVLPLAQTLKNLRQMVHPNGEGF